MARTAALLFTRSVRQSVRPKRDSNWFRLREPPYFEDLHEDFGRIALDPFQTTRRVMTSSHGPWHGCQSPTARGTKVEVNHELGSVALCGTDEER
jgi:hypothetical protein